MTPSPCRSLKITVEQKCDIATRELDELREDQQRKRDEFERARDYHKAVVDEADIRLADIKKSCYEFDRDIIRGAVNPVRLTHSIITMIDIILLPICLFPANWNDFGRKGGPIFRREIKVEGEFHIVHV